MGNTLIHSKGTYALRFHLAQPLRLAVGRLGICEFPTGELVYIGSALGPGGLVARLARHLRPDKPRHWHIDHLTAVLTPTIWQVDVSGVRLECAWVRELLALPGASVPIPGFGSSDCRAGCPAHLVAVPLAPKDELSGGQASQGACSGS